MKTKLKSFFSLLAILSIVASCQKEYSAENGISSGTSSGTAVYTFSGASGNCLAPIISGTYAAGLESTITTNTVVLQVTVTTAGTYVISTATINGLSFTGSGTFTITGVQTIVLTASGTPTVAGTFNYIPGTNGCSFTITITAGNSNTAVFTFPSAPNACNPVTVNGTYTAGVNLTRSNTIGLQVNVTTAGTYNISTVTNNDIIFTSSGSFAATGLQTITLTGSGTPLTSGPFNYSPGNNGCSFTITVLPADPLATDYIRCKINGVLTTFSDSAFFTETTTPAAPPVPATIALDISGNVSANSNENIYISLNKIGTAIVTSDIFNPSSFTSGKAYLISYTDAAAMSWNAVSGISVTPFTITVTNKTAIRVQGTFSGTVSDTGASGGNLKVITEGTFTVPIH